MQRPTDAIAIALSVALSAAAAFVALSAPGPMQGALTDTLRASTTSDSTAISPVRILIAVLPVGGLAARWIARRRSWR